MALPAAPHFYCCLALKGSLLSRLDTPRRVVAAFGRILSFIFSPTNKKCTVNLQGEIEKEGLDVEVRLLGSPCHAGHTAGCHHGTFSSLLWLCLCCCCSIQLCGHTAPSCPITCVALIGPSAGLFGLFWVFFFTGRAGRAPDGQGSEARRGAADGATLAFPSLRENGAPRTRRGETGGASRSFGVIVLFFSLL